MINLWLFRVKRISMFGDILNNCINALFVSDSITCLIIVVQPFQGLGRLNCICLPLSMTHNKSPAINDSYLAENLSFKTSFCNWLGQITKHTGILLWTADNCRFQSPLPNDLVKSWRAAAIKLINLSQYLNNRPLELLVILKLSKSSKSFSISSSNFPMWHQFNLNWDQFHEIKIGAQ